MWPKKKEKGSRGREKRIEARRRREIRREQAKAAMPLAPACAAILVDDPLQSLLV